MFRGSGRDKLWYKNDPYVNYLQQASKRKDITHSWELHQSELIMGSAFSELKKGFKARNLVPDPFYWSRLYSFGPGLPNRPHTWKIFGYIYVFTTTITTNATKLGSRFYELIGLHVSLHNSVQFNLFCPTSFGAHFTWSGIAIFLQDIKTLLI